MTVRWNLVACNSMKEKWFFLGGTLLLAALVCSSCMSSVDGRTHFGMPFVKDAVESRYERPAREIWTAAKDVLNANGMLYTEDTLKSTLEASVNGRTVWVKVEELDKSVTRVTVEVRGKAGGTDMELAGEIDKQIAIRLATGNLTPGSAVHPQKQ